MPRITRSPWLWFSAFLIWAGTLWFLSSRPVHMPEAPEIPHADKVAHFGYFFAGGVLWVFFLSFIRGSGNHRPLILATVLLLAVVGALDEWHQTFTPGRSGNDPLDWLADVLGAFAGATAGLRLRQTLLR